MKLPRYPSIFWTKQSQLGSFGAREIIQAELHAYGRGLSDRPQIVAINKADAVDEETTEEIIQQLRDFSEGTIFLISAVSHQGLNELLQTIWATIDRQKAIREAAPLLT